MWENLYIWLHTLEVSNNKHPACMYSHCFSLSGFVFIRNTSFRGLCASHGHSHISQTHPEKCMMLFFFRKQLIVHICFWLILLKHELLESIATKILLISFSVYSKEIYGQSSGTLTSFVNSLPLSLPQAHWRYPPRNNKASHEMGSSTLTKIFPSYTSATLSLLQDSY